MAGRIDARLTELGITLPEGSVPQANYVPYTISGNLVFISGQVPKLGDEDAPEATRLGKARASGTPHAPYQTGGAW